MFEFDEELFEDAYNNNHTALTILESIKDVITEINGISKDYENKSKVKEITDDILNILGKIENLDSQMKATLQLSGSLDTNTEDLNPSYSGGLLGQNVQPVSNEMSQEEMMAQLGQMQAEDIIKMFEQYNLSEEEMAQLMTWIEEGNIEAVMWFMSKCYYSSIRDSAQAEKDEVDKRLDYLGEILAVDMNGYCIMDGQLEAIDNFLEENRDNPEAIQGATFIVGEKEYSFGSYEEAKEFVRTFKQQCEKEYNGLKIRSSELDEEIKTCNKMMDYCDDNIEMYSNFGYAIKAEGYEEPDLQGINNTAATLGIDLNNCTINEALTVIRVYSEHDDENHGDRLNLIAVIDKVRNNSTYKDMSDDEFYSEFSIELASASSDAQAENCQYATGILYDLTNMIDIDYVYMTPEERKEYSVVLATEGREGANNYLELRRTVSLNARKGIEKGNEIFEDIVSQPGKFMEMVAAFQKGEMPGVIGWFENNYSMLTGEYDMTVNDWTIQTVEQNFNIAIQSCAPVTTDTIDEFARSGNIDSKTAEELKNRVANGEEIKYYELLGYVPEDKGGLTSEEVKRWDYLSSQIAGGETYTSVFLRGSWEGGISTGNMLPSIALGMIPVAGPYLSKASFFLSAAGGTYKEQRREGATWTQAMLAANVNGALELGTEYFIGGIPGLSESSISFSDFARLPTSKKLLYFGKMILNEELEETTQLFGGDFIMSGITGDPYVFSEKVEQLPITLVSTFMSTAALNSITYGVPTIISYGEATISLTPEDWANIYNQGFTPEVLGKFLDAKVLENTNQRTGVNTALNQNDLQVEYKNGKMLINGVELTLPEAREISSLVESLMTNINTNTIEINNEKIRNIYKFANNFTLEEREVLNKINPNWRNEMSVLEVMRILQNDSVDNNSIFGNLDNNTLSAIGKIENLNLTNTRELINKYFNDSNFKNLINELIKIKNLNPVNANTMIESYVNDSEFKNFVDRVMKMTNASTNSSNVENDLLAVSNLKLAFGNDYEQMNKLYFLYEANKSERKNVNSVEFLNNLIQNPEYRQYYLNYLDQNLDRINNYSRKVTIFNVDNFLNLYYLVKKISFDKGIFETKYSYENDNSTTNFLMTELSYAHGDIEGIKNTIKTIFPYLDAGFLELDNSKLGNGRGQYFQELFNVIMNSDDSNFIQNSFRKILETFGFKNIDSAMKDSIVYYRTSGMHLDELTNIKYLRHETINHNGKNVEVYYTDGQDFTFVTHSIAYNSLKIGPNKALGNSLLYNPALWEQKGLNENELLSLTTTYQKDGRFRTSYDFDNVIILGFSEIPLDQVLNYKSDDAATSMRGEGAKAYNQYDNSNLSLKYDTVQDFIEGKSNPNDTFYAYNEIVTTRYLPNGEKRLPDYILVTERHYQKISENVFRWAEYYNIPIVVVNDASLNTVQTSVDPFSDPFTADFFGITNESVEQTEVAHEAVTEQIETVLNEISRDFPSEESDFAQEVLKLYVVLNDSRLSNYYKNTLSKEKLQLPDKYKSKLQNIKVNDIVTYLNFETVIPVTGNNPTIVNSTLNLSNNTNMENWNCLTMEESELQEDGYYGRDNIVKEINGYKLKPDHVYRVMRVEEYEAILKTGYVFGFGKGVVGNEYIEYKAPDGSIMCNNMGVDWYLGGAALRYGKGEVVVECPATPQYFTTGYNNGKNMANDPHVKHMKSSSFLNPVPAYMIKLIKHPTIDVQLE